MRLQPLRVRHQFYNDRIRTGFQPSALTCFCVRHSNKLYRPTPNRVIFPPLLSAKPSQLLDLSGPALPLTTQESAMAKAISVQPHIGDPTCLC